MPDVVPLPVKVEPASGESGLGYLLRVARANGLSLASLIEATALPKSLWMSEQAIATLAHASGAETSWLRAHSVIVGWRDGHRCHEWRHQLWACPLSLRGTRPQVCPICLQEGRPCSLEWEATGVVVCLRHRRLLVDTCVHCGRRLSWWRPAIDVCACGHFFATEDEGDVDGVLMDWTEALIAKLRGAIRTPDNRVLPRWLDVLSADGLLAVGFAFGVRSEPLTRVTSAAARVPPSTSEMAALIGRGVARLQRAAELLEPCSIDLRLFVYEEGLRRLWNRNVDDSDRDAAAALLRWLGAFGRGVRHPSCARTDRQGELFSLIGSDD